MSQPHPRRAEHVDHPGLVLEVDKRHPLGRRGPLPMGHRTGDHHAVAVGHRSQRLGGQYPHRVQVGPQELGRVTVRGDAGGPHVGGGQFQLTHPRQLRDVRIRPHTRQPVRPLGGRGASRPQRLPPGHPEAAQRSCRRQRFGLRHAQLQPASQVQQRGERAVDRSLLDQLVGEAVADMADRAQPEADLRSGVLARGVRQAGVDACAVHQHAMPARIGHQRLR